MAIYRNTVYNPVYHSNIPANYRYQWKQSHNSTLSLTDEEIFNIWRDNAFDWYGPSEEYPTEDSYVMQWLEEAENEKGKE